MSLIKTIKDVLLVNKVQKYEQKIIKLTAKRLGLKGKQLEYTRLYKEAKEKLDKSSAL